MRIPRGASGKDCCAQGTCEIAGGLGFLLLVSDKVAFGREVSAITAMIPALEILGRLLWLLFWCRRIKHLGQLACILLVEVRHKEGIDVAVRLVMIS